MKYMTVFAIRPENDDDALLQRPADAQGDLLDERLQFPRTRLGHRAELPCGSDSTHWRSGRLA